MRIKTVYSSIQSNLALRFIVRAFGLYVIWFLCYDLFLHPNSRIDYWLIDNLTSSTAWFLRKLGFTLMVMPSGVDTMGVVGIDGSHGVLIGYPCNGLELFALFVGFMLAYPGSTRKKVWYIPLGLITIHLLNITRVIGLALLSYYAPQYMEFNHTYTFTLIVYGYVFVLWMVWAMKLSGINYGPNRD